MEKPNNNGLKDLLYGEGGMFILIGADEYLSHVLNNQEIVPHEYKWMLPMIALAAVWIKRRLMKKANGWAK